MFSPWMRSFARSRTSFSISSSASQRCSIGASDQPPQIEHTAHNRPRAGSQATRELIGKCCRRSLDENGRVQNRQCVNRLLLRAGGGIYSTIPDGNVTSSNLIDVDNLLRARGLVRAHAREEMCRIVFDEDEVAE